MFGGINKLIAVRKLRGCYRKEEHMLGNDNTAYRRIIIINTKTEEVLIDEHMIGPINQEEHLREIFINSTKLKGVKGKDMIVKTKELATFVSEKLDDPPDKSKKRKKKKH
jgi:hypothetical protein